MSDERSTQQKQPALLHRKVVLSSPWMRVVEKTVSMPDGRTHVYHCVSQEAYVGILAQGPDGLIPLVRQYRPCVENYTWEFPAGTVEVNEQPADAARREVLEETGLRTVELVSLGNFYPDTGRLDIDSHAFYARTESVPLKRAEQAMEIRYVSHAELRRMIRTLEFRHQLHLAIYAAALVHGISLGAFE